MSRWYGLKALVEDVVENGSRAVEQVHRETARRPFRHPGADSAHRAARAQRAAHSRRGADDGLRKHPARHTRAARGRPQSRGQFDRQHAGFPRLFWLKSEVMKPWELLGETRTPDGEDMTLTRSGSEYVILASGKPLMSSRMHGSEEALATFGCARARTLEQPCVLVGGLGMGFTLRATLDLLPPDATVVVAELVPAVVDWNRGPLGPLAGHPLKDRARAASRSATWRRRCARAPAGSTPCCSTSTMARPRSPPRTTPASTTIAGSPPRARRSRPAACWRCGRRGRIGKFEQRLRYGGFTVERGARARPSEKRRPAPHHLPRLLP